MWKQVGQNLSGLAKHIVKSVVSEPVEIVKDAVGVQLEQGKSPSAQSATVGTGQSDSSISDLSKAGFKTQDDFAKYSGLSGQKDQMEIEMLRKQLVREWGLDSSVEGGMQRARMEFEQKEQQRKQVEEHKEEQKKEFEFQKKKQEDIGLKAATQGSSAENKAWGAG